MSHIRQPPVDRVPRAPGRRSGRGGGREPGPKVPLVGADDIPPHDELVLELRTDVEG
ncbi:hypothetical protein ACQEUX_17815 [Micromonospora sp. CA-259024]|uniref:hypothetical protein n=1 Tax=Micromonospora sp. CA-259024 TaxID=3239965 RepID=UPI003D91E2D0